MSRDRNRTRRSAGPTAILSALLAALLGFSAVDGPAPAQAQTLKDLLEKRKEQRRSAPKSDEAVGEGAEAEEDAPRLSREEVVEQAYENLLSEEEPVWRAAEKKIIKAWSRSGSDSMDLLLQRGRSAIEREDWDAAIEHLTDLVNLAPEFAEGWSVRASVYYRKNDLGRALADLGEAIAHDPRHFGAYAGMGAIFEQIDDAPRAIAAYRKSLEIHPNLDASKKAVERLASTADGRPI